MLAEKTVKKNEETVVAEAVSSKYADITALVKLRLSMLVVFSAGVSFVLASSGPVDWSRLIMLIIGGFLVTGSANGFNQVIERRLDALMNRTRNRPLPAGRMKMSEALSLSILMGLTGLFLLGFFTTPLTVLFAALSLVSYAFIYTPLKQKSAAAVYVGAFPGAMPILLGWVAATGTYGLLPGLLFAVQFMWQFPHFWSIAWVADEDYQRAGFHLLPSKQGRGKKSALFILLSTLILLPVSLLPVYFGLGGIVTFTVTAFMGCLFLFQSFRLYRSVALPRGSRQTCDNKHARQLMFGSFIYLPVIQLTMMIDKITM